MKTVAYFGVSTAQQDAGSQCFAILKYARRQGFRVDDIERHEALLNLVVVRDHRRRPVAAGRLKLRAA